MTEDDAKTKWCPHARILGQGRDLDGCAVAGTVNRGQGFEARCIASACMAWRWQLERLGENKIQAIKRYREENAGVDLKGAKDWVEAHPEYVRQPIAARQGFCGLAGAPL